MFGNKLPLRRNIASPALLFALGISSVTAQKSPDEVIAEKQAQYYVREVIPTPKGIVLEAGGIAILPNKKVAVSSRRGDIWVCTGAYGDDLDNVQWTRYATGIHEPLGIFYRDGSIYATTRSEIKKMTDLDGDGVADAYETINDSWGINGDYHEYNIGSSPDKEGNIWVVHCLTGSSKADSHFRGWAFRYSMDGKKRSPHVPVSAPLEASVSTPQEIVSTQTTKAYGMDHPPSSGSNLAAFRVTQQVTNLPSS